MAIPVFSITTNKNAINQITCDEQIKKKAYFVLLLNLTAFFMV